MVAAKKHVPIVKKRTFFLNPATPTDEKWKSPR